MGQASIIAMAGTRRDLQRASQFPPDVKWDKVVKVEIPADHGLFPDTSGYARKDFEEIESSVEDPQLLAAMQNSVDAVLDFVGSKGDVLEKLGFQDIRSTIYGMNKGGPVFAIAGFVDWKPAAL